jgi:hypothetical protein
MPAEAPPAADAAAAAELGEAGRKSRKGAPAAAAAAPALKPVPYFSLFKCVNYPAPGHPWLSLHLSAQRAAPLLFTARPRSPPTPRPPTRR